MRRTIKKIIRLECLFFLAFLSPAVFANTLTGSWEGTYECSNRVSPFALEIVDEFNARVDFYVSADDKTVKASQWSELWHRDKEFLVIGSEWIIKPSGWALSTIKLSQVDDDTLEGSYEHRGCGAVNFERSANLEAKKEAEKLAQQQVPNEDFNLVAHYTCSGKASGSYWQITSNDDESYQVDVSARDHINASRVTLYSIQARKLGAGLQGFVSNGSFGIQLEFKEGTTAPTGYFTERSGAKNEKCEDIIFQTADAPEQYWQNYFEAAKNTEPTIDEVEALTALYRTLPSTNTLTVADANSYRSNRDTLWRDFTTHYVEQLPTHIGALAFDTADAKAQSRIQLTRMENPGFRMKTNIPALYVNNLFKNNLPIEPLYFADEQSACERTNTAAIPNSMIGLETFVGLPGYDWNETTGETFIGYLKACSAKNLVDAEVTNKAIQSIQRLMPQIMRQAQSGQELKNEASEMATRPRNLETLVATKGYSLRPYAYSRIDETTINRFFNSPLEPVKNEAIDNAAVEVDAFFNPADLSNPGATAYDLCIKSLGVHYNGYPDYLAPLHERCVDNAKQQLAGYLEHETARIESVEFNETNILNYIGARPSNKFQRFAQLTELTNENDKFSEAITQMGLRADEAYATMLESYFQENTAAADAKLVESCRQRINSQSIRNTCGNLTNNLKQRVASQQCDQAVERAELSTKLSDDIVVYGDGVRQQNITFKNLICRTSARGLNLKIEKEAKTIEVKGIDLGSNQTLFDATLSRSENNPEHWLVNSLGGALANTRFGNISHTALVHCLVSNGSC